MWPDTQAEEVEAPTNATASDEDAEHLKAKTRFAYIPSPDSPNDISFREGEILDIVGRVDNWWWQAKKADGTIGFARSNFVDIIPQAKALHEYTASEDDPNQISFRKGEILNIVDDKSNEWWLATKADGTIGFVPSNFLRLI
ncbi:hypothetical protein K438DRAFT_1881273 [Mycena galopus ATCC 62051]|nr:hypothetical protein K438DRAFT_1881273 [Mycena galopus ATCC 62051]